MKIKNSTIVFAILTAMICIFTYTEHPLVIGFGSSGLLPDLHPSNAK